MRVAAGGIAKKYLWETFGTRISGYLSQIGAIKPKIDSLEHVEDNPFFCPDPNVVDEIAALIDQLRRDGDSIGARINVVASNVPAGLGEPVFDKLDADLASALVSINAVKGVEFGTGFLSVTQRGSMHRDEIDASGFLSNNAGGVLGGISTGQNVEVSIALKPTSSLTMPGKSIDRYGNEVEVVTKGRHDPCVGIRAVPVGEAMMATTIADHCLRFL